MFKNKNYIPPLLLLLIAILLYLPALREFLYDWYHDDNYSHGFLIPFVSGYLVWQKREVLRAFEIKSNIFGLVILIFGLAIFTIGTAGAEWFVTRVSLIIVLAGILLYLFGKEIIKSIWFPIVFLIFMIPIPYVIYYGLAFPMQIFSTELAFGSLKLIGFSALRQGNIIHLPNYSLEVVAACSGLRSLISLSALSAVFAYITQRSSLKRSVLFLSAVPIAIIANVFRLFVTAIGAVIIGPEFAEGFLHEFSGLLVFVTAIILLIIEGGILNWIGRKKNIG